MLDLRPEHPDITEEMWTQIDEITTANRSVPGSAITVLRVCQDIVGYLPVVLINYISERLNLPRSTVFGVATFYSLFSLQPKGRHTIKVCMGTACYVKGIKEVIDRIRNQYQIEEGGTSEDRRFTLEAIRCLGACGLAPVAIVDDDIHGGVSANRIINILEEYA
jgi:NADH:ubiquinone oxidoreductase subunit E